MLFSASSGGPSFRWHAVCRQHLRGLLQVSTSGLLAVGSRFAVWRCRWYTPRPLVIQGLQLGYGYESKLAGHLARHHYFFIWFIVFIIVFILFTSVVLVDEPLMRLAKPPIRRESQGTSAERLSRRSLAGPGAGAAVTAAGVFGNIMEARPGWALGLHIIQFYRGTLLVALRSCTEFPS